jgi:hypothetical protein
MATTSDFLKTLTPDQLDDLALMVAERRNTLPGGKKIDYDNMTDAQRWEFNKTLTPATNKTEHIEYPRMLYGMREGIPVQVTVDDTAHEQVIRERYPYDWKYSMLEHGIETCPTHGDGIKPIDFAQPQAVPALPAGLAPDKFAQGVIQSQEAAGKRGPGRPRKTA